MLFSNDMYSGGYGAENDSGSDRLSHSSDNAEILAAGIAAAAGQPRVVTDF
eukprot:SAG31_NODE_1239_length_9169_cov_18.922492_12_plen_51_part_00